MSTDTAEGTVFSVDPRTGAETPTTASTTSYDEVDRLGALAATAAPEYEVLGRARRAEFLRAIADKLDAARALIVETATAETGLPEARLNGELTRTSYQMRLFADVLDDGAYLEATIDLPGDTPMGPGPDLRRLLVPIGPVAVFGASNFPLAFSVPGGDTASALAAGSPVIVKAHGSHPATSIVCFEAMAEAARDTNMPHGVLGIVFGQSAGGHLVANPNIKAVGFTGSLGGGKALMDIISKRDEPIPFYGELASLNPLVVTAGAGAARAGEIASGLATSITASAGQLCTKPGLVFVPASPVGDALVEALVDAIETAAPAVVLNERIFDSYNTIAARLAENPAVTTHSAARPGNEPGFRVAPTVITVDAKDLSHTTTQECFGPLTVVARYSDDAELRTALNALPGSLTATIHSEPDEVATTLALTTMLRDKAGRLTYNSYPTGVLVSWAQNHSGPWPATNTLHTSVGTTAIRRFLRPLTWQNAPESVLPPELWDVSPTPIPRRVDGVLQAV
ncbi:aldehyde dehydrogenase (NADP(+)) [Nocardia jinanensis]|uniref:Aldehyde dehydrogenase n=1 Tax=Nocardia jinanensis TaxID=382504 RepID=A0A917RKL5_9NOCA|nr:aldehyde dehydrogenase (NADP(+)) [Nocardia jinanensis]GGL10777.1 aldehyde dehydrogenase [Nocardia jinanensis]